MHPRPGNLYQINWDLAENIYDGGNRERERGIEQALALREWLSNFSPQQLPGELVSLLQETEGGARGVIGSDVHKPLHCALFVFDDESKTLRYCVGNYKADDARRAGKYRFGLGLPGRAFKAGRAVGFRRPPATPGERPWGYVLPDGTRVTKAKQVPEVAIVAIPLAPVEASDWPYAVIQFSTDDYSCDLKTQDRASDTTIADYSKHLAKRITALLE